VEIDNDRRAWLRFGNGDPAYQPPAGTAFYASYRTGSGESGNIGADTLTVLVLDGLTLDGITIDVTNPLPAWGGMEPEPLNQVRLLAPYMFRTERMRAVTADDYAELVMRKFENRLQRAAARLHWTGSFYEACVVIDPQGDSIEEDDPLLDEIRDWLMDYRRIGHDLVVKPARYVPVYLSLHVCVLPGFIKGHVKTALLERFSNRKRINSLGFFHPDALTFGQGVALSQVIAAARGVAGVESVTVERLERFGSPSRGALEGGLLPMDLFEIPRLDNDPSQPENGRLEITLEGGR
jgi:predicted phage baseplate assembly protein